MLPQEPCMSLLEEQQHKNMIYTVPAFLPGAIATEAVQRCRYRTLIKKKIFGVQLEFLSVLSSKYDIARL